MIVHCNGIDIFYEVRGSGAPLLMLHGNGETHAIFDKAADLLARYFTVYTPDTRGHGASSPVFEYHYQDMASDVICFIQALGLDRPILYGFSDGGITALLVAQQRPDLVSRVIASGANACPEGLTEDFLSEIRAAALSDKEQHDPLLTLMLTEPHMVENALAAISVPVFLLAGEHDVVREEHSKWLSGVINCPLKVLKGQNHDSYVTHSTMIAAEILKILGISDENAR